MTLQGRVSRGNPRRDHYRSLRCEPLEERRLLAMGDLVQTLVQPIAPLYEQSAFGYSAAVSGSTVVVGNPTYDRDVPGHYPYGVAYVFNSDTGKVQHVLSNPNPVADGKGIHGFGGAVAVSGNLAVVGAGLAGGMTSGGLPPNEAYVFDTASGRLLQTLKHPGVTNSWSFGRTVAISGNLAVVADPFAKTGAGAVHVYDVSSGSLLRSIDSPFGSVYFGDSMGLSGNTLVVGCREGSPAYVFDATTGVLQHRLSDPSPAAGHQFGFPVEISGTHVAVADRTRLGENAWIHLFDATSGAFVRTISDPTPEENNLFGYAFALSGAAVVVYEYPHTYVFHGATGELLHTVTTTVGGGYGNEQSFAASGNRWVRGCGENLGGGVVNTSALVYDIGDVANVSGGITSFTPPAAVEGQPIVDAVVATFTDTRGIDPTAVITWGDGTRTVLSTWPSADGQIVRNSDESYSVYASHTYKKAIPAPGQLSTITVNGAYFGDSRSALVTVADRPLHVTEVKHPAGLQIKTDKPIAHFTDDNPFGEASDYTAKITWFDQETDAVTSSTDVAKGHIVANAGGFDVFASHTYDTNIDKPREKFSVTVSAKVAGGATDTKELLPKNYALLFSGGVDIQNNLPAYHTDIFAMYQALVNTHRLDPKDIYILFADGTDIANDCNYGTFDVPFPGNSNMAFAAASHVLAATLHNLQTTLQSSLAPVVTAGDHFLFYCTDHGNGEKNKPTTTGEEVLCGWDYDVIRDEFLPPWLELVHAGYNTYVFTECYSGGMVDDLLPLAANQFAVASANHYESSFDPFAFGFSKGLMLGHASTQAAFQYARARDPYAAFNEVYAPNGGTFTQDAPDWHNWTEHPFSIGEDFPIFFRPGAAPVLKSFVSGAGRPDMPIPLPYKGLRMMSDAAAADGNAVDFLITSLSSGTLTMNGDPIVPGETVVGYGDTLLWTPPSGAAGLQQAFTVRAWDGQNLSDTDVPVSVNLIAATDWVGGMLEVVGGDAEGNVHCGAAALGQSSPVRSFTLASYGPQSLQISNFAKTGDQPADFHITVRDDHGAIILDLPAAGGAATGGTSFAIPAGATYTVDVVFVPQDTDVCSVQITFNTNDPRDQGQARTFGADGAGRTPLQAPTLTAVASLTGAHPGRPLEVTWSMLVDASDVGDSNLDPRPVFRVEQVSSGTLTWNGQPVVLGDTEIGIGQSLVWTPPTDALGDWPAFSVRAGDGPLYSATAVPVRVNVQPFGVSACGVYDPVISHFYLRNSNTQGGADSEFAFGAPGWESVAGDWNGDGQDTIGLFQREASQFYLRNQNAAGNADISFGYGVPGSNWFLLMGDWDGNGTDTIGSYDPAASQFYLKNANAQGNADISFGYGAPGLGWTPLVGDWNGDGTDTIGFYDAATGMFYLRNTNDMGMADVAFPYGVPGSNWQPLIGDWDGNGEQTIGFFLPAASTFFLRNTNTIGNADVAFGLGYPGCQPIVGDWLGPTGQALMAAECATLTTASPTVLAQPDLQPIVREALARWTDVGVTLAAPRVVVTDLPGSLVGQALGDTIYLDRDAAGHGWFVDSTPGDDTEFVRSDSGQLRALDAQAVDRIDLLTVVEHELGHLAGLDDLDASSDRLMSGMLPAGVRRLAGMSVGRLDQ